MTMSETPGDLGINRYMVECEYDFNGLAKGFDRVLIDTWWNVNVFIFMVNRLVARRINRYMVECE